MSSRTVPPTFSAALAAVFFAILSQAPAPCPAQLVAPSGVEFHLEGPARQLNMIVNTSRIMTTDKQIPKVLVNDSSVLLVKPLGTNQLQISALKQGVTQIAVWDSDGRAHTIDVIVYADTRELEITLKDQYPTCSLKIRPLSNSVMISGYVDRPEAVYGIIKIAEEWYPNVITNITVGGVQTVLLHVRMMEVSRTKLRKLGFDWANINGDDFVVQSVSGIIAAVDPLAQVATAGGDTVRFGIVSGSNTFFGFLEALRQYNMVKVLANPTIVTTSGRPAAFNVGGEFPILVPGGLGTTTIEYKQFGTRVDFVPIVLGNGNLRLEVRPQISEVDSARSVSVGNVTVPGLRDRWVDTAVEMKPGQTLALAGLVQERIETENKGIPWLADLPWAGAMFRRVEERKNEIELLIMVTPELVSALDPHEVPPCPPGTRTTSPCDVELFFKGYMETPKCCPPGAPPVAAGPGGLFPQPGETLLLPSGEGETEAIEQVPIPAPQPPAPRNSDSARRNPPATRAPVGDGSSRVPSRLISTPLTRGGSAAYPKIPETRHDAHDPENRTRVPEDPGLIGPFGYDDLH
jgi:pilus assembly protein CpaC